MERNNDIPWSLLTAHLQYVFANTDDKQGATNLFPQFDESQGRDLNAFVEVMAQTIEEAARAERRKYIGRYDPPDAEAILLDDDLVKRINPIAHRLKLWQWNRGGSCTEDFTYSPKLCSHEDDDAFCKCPIPFKERKASSFLRQNEDDGCYAYYQVDKLGTLNLEIVKTLIVSGDIEPILRVCAHPENGLESWWYFGACSCGVDPPGLGWERLYQRALESYICLNVLYRFPEIRHHDSGEQDYRRTKCYQKLLRHNAISGTQAVRLQHMEFFGLCEGQFSVTPKARAESRYAKLGEEMKVHQDLYPYGVMPIHDFLEFETIPPHLPKESDVVQVRRMLGGKRLPAEIVLRIMDLADYEARRRLAVPHDPFHRDNNAELEVYLSQCWKVLLRCNMMVKALADTIQWDELISQCIAELWMDDLREDTRQSEKAYTCDEHGLCTFH